MMPPNTKTSTQRLRERLHIVPLADPHSSDFLVACASSSLEGEQIQHFGKLPEPYMDPVRCLLGGVPRMLLKHLCLQGYVCYNPGSCYVGTDCPEGKIDVDVTGDTPDLSK